MELTKEQIKYIDHHLENEGIKYWDIRIEMIDHIVSDIEKNAISIDFKKELATSLKRIGSKGTLKNINTIGWKNTNAKYRREYGKGIVSFFKSTKNIVISTFSVLIYYLIAEYFSFKIFKNISFALIFLPLLTFLFQSIKQIGKKYGRSVNLDYGTTYFLFAFLMIGTPIQFLKYTSETNQKWILLILIPLYFIATYSGFKLYKKAIHKIEKMKSEMKL
ncbi:hypothetical protein MPF19_02075 [Polaribacter sp. Z014]|uniref:hypothetical protein n=1 Tax=Polaribacter sp. Z014 TaxID=2927126 RepID=UPI002021C92B|nr:hypothetical protein [Polaribacter sp. Z014]MCL7762186.1 hypothetical protein [Polaribacter sp. Z014]